MRTQNTKKNIWSSFFLMILSAIAFSIFGILGIIYSNAKHLMTGNWRGLYYYWEAIFYKLAVAFDQIGNILVGEPMNDLIVKGDFHAFGDEDETVSEATGKNLVKGTLNSQGLRFNAMLDFIFGLGHAVDSIEKD